MDIVNLSVITTNRETIFSLSKRNEERYDYRFSTQHADTWKCSRVGVTVGEDQFLKLQTWAWCVSEGLMVILPSPSAHPCHLVKVII